MKILLKLLLILSILLLTGLASPTHGEEGKTQGHVIAVLATVRFTGHPPTWAKITDILTILEDLRIRMPGGIELFELRGEKRETLHEKFWGVLSLKHTTHWTGTRWKWRSHTQSRTLNIRLRLRDKNLRTNWENLKFEGYKRPGSSKDMSDWEEVNEWTLVPNLNIAINESDTGVLISYLDDASPAIRTAAVKRLGELNVTGAAEILIPALKDENWVVRSRAALALGKIKDTRGVDPLIGVLKDEDYGVRSDTAWALGEMKDVRAVEPLIAILNDEVSVVRRNGVQALEKITGQSFGEDPFEWKNWWEKNKPR